MVKKIYFRYNCRFEDICISVPFSSAEILIGFCLIQINIGYKYKRTFNLFQILLRNQTDILYQELVLRW